MAAEVASAYVSLMPSAKGFGGKVNSAISGDLDKAGKSGGSRLSSALGGVLKKSVIGIGATAGGLLGTALFKGFNRLTAIENATAKLRGLGHSAAEVKGIMDNALASVKGTAFGLDEAATVAAGTVAAGIKPGKDLQRVLGLVADSATIAGTSMGDMGAIFNKVASSNKLQGDVINQLNDAGIPIVQLLGKSMHKTTAEVLKMSKAGTISFKDFSTAMQKGLGGAALKSGNTTQGALKNVGAAVSRFGASLLSGLFPIAKRVFGGIITVVDNMTAKAGPMMDRFAGFITGTVIPAVKRFMPTLKDVGSSIVNTVVPGVKNLVDVFGPLVVQFGKVAGSALVAMFKTLGGLLKNVVGPGFLAVTGFMRDHATTVRAIVVAVGAGVVAWKLWTTSIKVWTTVTKIATGVQAAFTAVMDANPVMLVVLAIAALAAGLIYAYKNSETFRKVVNTAFHAIGEAGRWLWNNALQPAFHFIAQAIATVTSGVAKMLWALSHVPGFGWAKTAAILLDHAATKAQRMADNINKIPKNPRINFSVTANYSAGAARALQLANSNVRLHNYAVGTNAAGTDNWRGGLTWVGENGPELMNLPRGTQIHSNEESKRIARGDSPLVVVNPAAHQSEQEIGTIAARQIVWGMR